MRLAFNMRFGDDSFDLRSMAVSSSRDSTNSVPSGALSGTPNNAASTNATSSNAASTSATTNAASTRKAPASIQGAAATARPAKPASKGTIGRRTGIESAWPWILRILWFLAAPLSAPLLGEGLATHSRSVQLLVTVSAWVIWGAGFVATLVPHPIGLVTLRIAGPTMLAFTLWASTQRAVSHSSLFLGLPGALIVALAVSFHETGHVCVNGPAYPNERRFLLRPAAPLFIVAPIAGALVSAGLILGPLLLATNYLILGTLSIIFGLAFAYVLSRSLYGLARRFVVFVPAGFVLHDYSALREPVLFKRGQIEGMRAAPADTDSLDLTMGAPGLVIEFLLKEKVEMSRLVGSRDRVGETGRSARFLATPTLPGRLLAEARTRRYPVG